MGPGTIIFNSSFGLYNNQNLISDGLGVSPCTDMIPQVWPAEKKENLTGMYSSPLYNPLYNPFEKFTL